MSTPLRIALIASSAFPVREPFAGGLEAHVWHLARGLSERGHEVSLFAAPGSEPPRSANPFQIRALELSPVARADPTTPGWMVHEHHAYLSVMLDLAGPLSGRFDVVHNHSLHYLPIAMSPTIATPMVTTLHTPPIAWLESAVAITAGRTRHRFAAVSRFTSRQWEQVVGPIALVPNGVDLDRWRPGAGDGGYAAWSGRLVPEKGVGLAIAAARAAGLPLRLAGPISDPPYFDEAVRPLLGDDVTYVGHLRQGALADLVGRATVTLVTPTWEEPYGLVVAESLACGTPVAAFARGGIPEILDESSGRLAAAGDVVDLARAAREALALSRTAARHRAEAVCGDVRMVEDYVSLYRATITDAQRPLAAIA